MRLNEAENVQTHRKVGRIVLSNVRCERCNSKIVIHNLEETVIKSRAIIVKNDKTVAICKKCKMEVRISV